MKTEIYRRLDTVDGVIAICVVNPNTGEALVSPTPGWRDVADTSMRIVELSDLPQLALLIGEKPSQRRIIAAQWPRYCVAVEVIPGHPSGKSIQRVLRSVGRQYGGLEIQSNLRSQPCNTEPPAPSSRDLTTPSSPSPAVTTPATGASPEVG